jgi:hypothetical protein
MAKDTSSADVAYSKEISIYNKYKELVKRDDITLEESKKGLKELVKYYGRLLDDVKLLTSVGDRLQRKLKSANSMLNQQAEEIKQINQDLQKTNNELKLTIDELTRTRAGRKARTFVLFVAVILFVFSENIENVLDSMLGESTMGIILNWTLKITLMLLLKPLEGFVENRMVKSAMDKKRRQMLDQYLHGEGESGSAATEAAEQKQANSAPGAKRGAKSKKKSATANGQTSEKAPASEAQQEEASQSAPDDPAQQQGKAASNPDASDAASSGAHKSKE